MHRVTVTTQQAARALGCCEATLKRWCDRGILPALRTPGGHRRVPMGSLLTLVRGGDHELKRPEAVNLPAALCSRQTPIEQSWEAYRAALLIGDEEKCRAILLGHYLNGATLAELCDLIVVPAFAALGDMWACGQAEIFEEHRACELCLRQMTQLQSLVTVHNSQAPLAIGCTPAGDPYAIPTIMVQMVLSEAGWRAVSLGRGIPLESLTSAVEHMQPGLVWLSVSTIEDVDAFVDSYRQFFNQITSQDVTLLLGGRALTDELRQRLQYSFFGDSMRHIRSFLQAMSRSPELTKVDS